MKTPGNALRASACLVFLAALAFLCGCSTVGSPRGKEADAIKQNRKTIVLARVVCMDDVQGQNRPTTDFILNSWQLRDASDRVETSPFEKFVPQRSLSKSLREQGWFYIVMNPGTYCLKMNPGSDSVSEPAFYLSIPANKQFLYAGTIIFNRKTETKGKKDVTKLSMDRVSDESPAAQAVVRNEFPDFGEMTSRLLVSYDDPPLNHDYVMNTESGPTDSIHSPSPTVKGDNLAAATIIEAPGAAVLGIGYAAGSGGGGEGALYIAGAGLAYMIAVAPLAVTSWGITSEIHREKWAKYEPALRKQVAEFHLDEKLRQAFANRLRAVGTNSRALPALRLEVQPYRVVLRGDVHQNFIVEVAVRVRLLNAADRRTVWEHDYAYTRNDPILAPYNAYQTVITFGGFADHRIQDFRGDSGAELMRDELQSAVDAITEEIANRLNEGNASPKSDPAIKSVAVTAETPPQSPP